MATAVLDDEHLEELARDHFTYEVHTFITAFAGLLRFRVAGEVSSPDGNIYLEAFVFHARALDDFLRSTGKRVDDLQATDYLPGWKTLEILDADERERVNGQGQSPDDGRLQKGGFAVGLIAYRALNGVLKFIEDLPTDRRAWFAAAEQAARDVRGRMGSTPAQPTRATRLPHGTRFRKALAS